MLRTRRIVYLLWPIGFGVVPLAGAAAGAGWVEGEGFRSQALEVAAEGKAGFEPLDSAVTGVTFANRLSDRMAARNQIRLVGSGVALGDVDGDGRCDIYLCQLEGPNALYRNLGGWKFEDVSERAGVACEDQFSTGCVLADLDGDGDPDLLVNSLGTGTRCFINDGAGVFREREDTGLRRERSGTTLALADLEGDGDLDLYVANYRTTTIRSTGLEVLEVDGRRMLRPEDRDQYEFTPEGLILEHGEVDFPYLNDGTGRFSEVPWTGGRFLDENGKALTAGPKDWSLSAMFRDVNGDRAPDIYVCSDFWSPDRFWINDGSGHFRALPERAMRNTSTFSMGIDFSDINRDGYDDFLVLDMQSRSHERRMRQRIMPANNVAIEGAAGERFQVERNTLQLNRGDGTYAEIAQLSGLQASEWSWGVAFLDVDLDGYEDVLITTGHGFDTQDTDTEERIARMGPVQTSKTHTKLLMYPRLSVPNVAFRNRGDLTFEEIGEGWGFNREGVSHGIALGDLDGDGDADVVVNNLNAEASLYRNRSAGPRVAVRLKGTGKNSAGIGARVELKGGVLPQSREIVAGGRYLSGDMPERVFAAGGAREELRLEVVWRDGGRSVVHGVKPNHRYEIVQPARPVSADPVPAEKGVVQLFQKADTVKPRHHEEPFDDYQQQSWLSRQLSHLGPGIAWCDLDDDGWEDLIVGSGRGGRFQMFHNRGNGQFDAVGIGALMGPVADDQAGIVGWPSGAGTSTIWVAQSNYETGRTNLPSVVRYELRPGGMQMMESLPGTRDSAGPLAAADVDADGDLDLFVGGRVISGRYPEPAASRLYLNGGRRHELATNWTDLGLVTGAVFSDLNGDGFPELIVAREWDSLRLFENRAGRFVDVTEASGLAGYRGWWNGVTTGDFDGDGRLDIVASNWGRNHPCQRYLKGGIQLAYGDLALSGMVEGVEAYREPGEGKVVPWRDLTVLSRALPWLRTQFATHRAFAQATLDQVLDSRVVKRLGVNWLDSTAFLNRGGRFEARSLPVEAQFAPAFGVSVGDVDGDGNEDLFLSQNFSRVEPQWMRAEAGRGLWLAGDGSGAFRPLSARETGIDLPGDQRGSALADFNGDGRLDLAVTQNAGETRVFRNERARTGLRVRLAGAGGNRAGVGAVLRLEGTRWKGPAREVHAGSGYWSQDGMVQVLSLPGEAGESIELTVRWPGGTTTRAPVPAGAREIEMPVMGPLRVVR